jgi:poly [ADP-ribose] polymerase
MYYPGTPSSSFFVVKNNNDQWYDVVLNQCNITGSSNNNKYYRLQLLESTSTGKFHVWFKWGRVGESSTGRDLKGPFATEAAALKVFSKKYRDKTKNAWGDDDFVAYTGKYTRIEIDYEVEVKSEFKTSDADDDVEYLKSELDPKTRELVEVLFSKEMRDNALTSFNLDLKKLPLGVPSQQQIQNGVSILNEIEDKLNGGDVSDSYAMLSSQFYTAIPHSFGRRRPPVISTQSSLQDRYDMCNILLDMFSTNETLRQVAANTMKKQVPYPADSHYETLKADLSPIGTKTQEYKVVEKYFNETKSSGSSSKLLDVWSVDREGESKRHKRFDKVDNRRLLWHGTNIAVAAPIITSGLRIMPHSGGRVGSGIYLAAMQEKSAQYTSAYGAKFACMFLCEAALGKSHQVTSDGHHASSLKKAPSGFDSVHAVGSITPKSWTTTDIEGKSVEVPKTKAHNSGVSSSFHHDEFLVYDEAQVRLRYVVTVRL